MIGLALRHLAGRRAATALAACGLLIATLGFVTLVSTAQTARATLTGDIARTWNTPYDLLVRPASAVTGLEAERGLVRSNYVSALAGGGITRAQLDTVRRVPGVAVAAPVAIVGAVNWPTGGFGTDLAGEPAGEPLAVYRFEVTSRTDAGLSSYPIETHYLVVSAEGEVRYADRSRDAVLTVRGRSVDCRYPVTCFAPTECADGVCRPADPDRSYGLEILQPLVIAGVDPAAEAALAGLDSCVRSGRYLAAADGPVVRGDRDPPGTTIPALVSTRSFVDESLTGRLGRASDAGAVLAGTGPPALVGWQDLRVERTTAAQLYADNLARVSAEVDEWPIWTVGDARYAPVAGGLSAVAVPADPGLYRRDNFRLTGEQERLAVPPSARDDGFRAVTTHGYRGQSGNRYWSPVGTYDPNCLPGFDPLAGGPLETYSAPTTLLPDGRPLLPNRSLTGYVNSPPLVLTTLDSAAWLSDPARFAGRPGEAFLSVIRVRVDGADAPDAAARARLARIAADIRAATGLQVDVVKGASPTDVSVALPAGQFGRPAVTVREPWAVKGVALRFTEEVSAQNLALFAVALVAATLLVGLTAAGSVRRRRGEFAVLRALGWPARRIALLVEVEMLLLGVVVGVVALLLGLLLVRALGGGVVLPVVALAVPAAALVAALATLPPALAAGRGSTAAALRRTGRVRRSRLPSGPAGVGLRDVTGVWRREALLGAAAIALGSGMLGLVVLVAGAFRDGLDRTVLGVYLGGRVQGFHLAIALITVVIGALAAGQVVTLGYLERQSQLAALRALGWTRRHIVRLLGGQALAIGLLGGAAGATVTWVGGLLLAASGAGVTVAAGASAAAALSATGIAVAGPLLHAYRTDPSRVLREG